MKYNLLTIVLVIFISLTPLGQLIAQDAACVDTDGDGFGWNGVETCTPTNTEYTACLDTDPIGDGWGWNGITACQVPPTNNSRDELAIIAAKTNNMPDGSAAVVYCPTSAETLSFFYSGKFISSSRPFSPHGVWATGVDANDGWLRVTAPGRAASRMYIEGGTVQQEYNGELFSCEWQ